MKKTDKVDGKKRVEEAYVKAKGKMTEKFTEVSQSIVTSRGEMLQKIETRINSDHTQAEKFFSNSFEQLNSLQQDLDLVGKSTERLKGTVSNQSSKLSALDKSKELDGFRDQLSRQFKAEV